MSPLRNDRNLDEPEDDHDWTFVETRLRALSPKPARLDMQAIKLSRDATWSTLSTDSFARNSAARLWGSWSFGVVVGAAAMLCFVRWSGNVLQSEPTQPTTAPIAQSPIAPSPNSNRSMEPKKIDGSIDESWTQSPSTMDVAMNRLATIGSSPLHAGFHLIFSKSASVENSSPDPMLDSPAGPAIDEDPSLRNVDNRSSFDQRDPVPKSREQLLKELMNESQSLVF